MMQRAARRVTPYCATIEIATFLLAGLTASDIATASSPSCRLMFRRSRPVQFIEACDGLRHPHRVHPLAQAGQFLAEDRIAKHSSAQPRKVPAGR